MTGILSAIFSLISTIYSFIRTYVRNLFILDTFTLVRSNAFYNEMVIVGDDVKDQKLVVKVDDAKDQKLVISYSIALLSIIMLAMLAGVILTAMINTGARVTASDAGFALLRSAQNSLNKRLTRAMVNALAYNVRIKQNWTFNHLNYSDLIKSNDSAAQKPSKSLEATKISSSSAQNSMDLSETNNSCLNSLALTKINASSAKIYVIWLKESNQLASLSAQLVKTGLTVIVIPPTGIESMSIVTDLIEVEMASQGASKSDSAKDSGMNIHNEEKSNQTNNQRISPKTSKGKIVMGPDITRGHFEYRGAFLFGPDGRFNERGLTTLAKDTLSILESEMIKIEFEKFRKELKL